MVTHPVIIVENLSKKYILRHKSPERYSTLRDTISGAFKNLFSSGKKHSFSSSEEFLALNDVTFEINPGDRLGIIGRNGAGKSTLLKVLSRIVEPSKGRITIEGRVASLLEVGTGFHPELSGRENIFLNGSVLGMTKPEIKSKFDEIVAFAEVEQFLDTPVKRYSSGMYVRLAFAVAAHLEPEILIVDEVLAVGDAEFQRKCLGKMKDVAGDGRTILFVSHNMEAVQKLCTTGLLLDKGSLMGKGSIDEVVKKYLNAFASKDSEFTIHLPENHLELPGYATFLRVEDMEGNALGEIPIGASWQIRIIVKLNRPVSGLVVGLGITTQFDFPLRTTWTPSADRDKGTYEVVFKGDDLFFAEGQYKLIVGLSSGKRTFHYADSVGYLNISAVSSIYRDESIINTKSGIVINQMKTIVSRTGD